MPGFYALPTHRTLCIMEPSITTSALHQDPRTGLELATRLGFRLVTLSAAQPGLRPRDLDRSARRGLLAELNRLELGCGSLDLFIPPEHFLNAETVDRAIEAVGAGLELATDLGASAVTIRLPSEDPEQEVLEATAELVRLAERSAARLLDVGLHGRALRSLESGSPIPIGIGLDTASWLADQRDPLEGLVGLGSMVGAVRLVDLDDTGTRCPPTLEGRLDLGSLKRAMELDSAGRSVVIDARGWATPLEGALKTLTAWRSDLGS